jgi:hypothetical protein
MRAPLAVVVAARYSTSGTRESGAPTGTSSENGKDAWSAALEARIQA